jgi:endonuclease/exonuclease/phosphatase family metal-dependent hydrolase
LRFLLYNIRYGTGRRTRWAWLHTLAPTSGHLPEIARFIRAAEPDVVGLVEVDSGSYRSGRRNQAAVLARAIGHYHSYRMKYREDGGLGRLLPVLNKQANAFLTRDAIRRETFHEFSGGFKRLVIELELAKLNLFIVHLALRFRTRHGQLAELHDLIAGSSKPCIVAGDFNSHLGPRELRLFLKATGLKSANAEHAATYPSWRPRRELDFVCYSPELVLRRFEAPAVTLSDHLPLICDFDLPAAS